MHSIVGSKRRTTITTAFGSNYRLLIVVSRSRKRALASFPFYSRFLSLSLSHFLRATVFILFLARFLPLLYGVTTNALCVLPHILSLLVCLVHFPFRQINYEKAPAPSLSLSLDCIFLFLTRPFVHTFIHSGSFVSPSLPPSKCR